MTAALLTHGADVNAKEGKHGCGGRSLFRATVGGRRAAKADWDGIGVMQIRIETHTRTHARTCMRT